MYKHDTGDAFILVTKDGSGKVVVEQIVQIPEERRKSVGAANAVILGKVVEGKITDCANVVLKHGKNDILSDTIGRIESDRQPIDEAKSGTPVGILLMSHNVRDIEKHAPQVPRPFSRS